MTIQEIKQKNIEAGKHFFDKETLRFWHSRVSGRIYKDFYFITSEKVPNEQGEIGERRYTIRKFNPDDCEIETIAQLQQFHSFAEAKDYIMALDNK